MKQPFIILSGPKFSGKSALASQLAKRIKNGGQTVSGFFQRGVFENGEKIGYDLAPACGGLMEPIIRRGADGKWNFFPEAFEKAAELVTEADAIILDEIGPLEISGSGHNRALKKALDFSGAIIVVVRDSLADELVKYASGRTVEIVSFDPVKSKKAEDKIAGILNIKSENIVKQ